MGPHIIEVGLPEKIVIVIQYEQRELIDTNHMSIGDSSTGDSSAGDKIRRRFAAMP
jgi:hypothetical protein